MTTKHIFTILTILFFYSCIQQNKENSNTITANTYQDSIKLNSTPEFDKHFYEILKQIQEPNLDTTDTLINEFRFFYFPSFENNKLFKLNLIDSSLVVKEFVTKKPDGSGKDSLVNSKKIKLDFNDMETFNKLIDKSMFWYLESNIFRLSIDGSLYIYEYRQPIQKKLSAIKKEYHIVRCNNPQNFDFANVGQFFLFKAGYANTYKKCTKL